MASPTCGYAQTPVGPVHYARLGAGAPVVCIHQTPRSWDEFREVQALLSVSFDVIAMDLPGMEILASVTPVAPKTGKPKMPHAATIYDGPKDNVVFNAGTIWWAQGLSLPAGHVLPANLHDTAAWPEGVDPRVQRMMKNVFYRFIN